jgi:hypothetical protein
MATMSAHVSSENEVPLLEGVVEDLSVDIKNAPLIRIISDAF